MTGANQEMRFYLELDTDGLSGQLLFKGLVKGKSNPDHMRPRGRTGAGASELMDMSGMWSAHLRIRPTKPLVVTRWNYVRGSITSFTTSLKDPIFLKVLLHARASRKRRTGYTRSIGSCTDEKPNFGHTGTQFRRVDKIVELI